MAGLQYPVQALKELPSPTRKVLNFTFKLLCKLRCSITGHPVQI